VSAAPVDPPGLPRGGHGLPARRRRLGLLTAVLLLATMTVALVAARGHLALGSVLLLYLLAVVVVSVVGGIQIGVGAALVAFLLANFFLTPPYHTLAVESRDSVVGLLVFLVVAVTVSALVDLAARRQAQAARSDAEAVMLGRVATEPLASRAPEDVLAEIASAFALTSVELVELGPPEVVLARVGPAVVPPGTMEAGAGDDRLVRGSGPALFAEDRRLLGSLARAASRALDVRSLALEASRAGELAAIDRLRSALLAAVGHDLRTPLAGIKAAVTTLRQPEVELGPEDRDELLATIEGSADRLTDLLANLLDLSRLQAGALSIDLAPAALDEVVARALLDRHLEAVVNDVPDDLPYVLADAGLLERVVANLVDNAHRYCPAGASVRLAAEADGTGVTLQVVDHGPGVPEDDRERIFVAFQRLDDRSTTSGVGLGLAIARGFTDAMGGSLRPADTPGGGLTMALTLPIARREAPKS
jgi:K+-sensing histidine kinase KdpD